MVYSEWWSVELELVMECSEDVMSMGSSRGMSEGVGTWDASSLENRSSAAGRGTEVRRFSIVGSWSDH